MMRLLLLLLFLPSMALAQDRSSELRLSLAEAREIRLSPMVAVQSLQSIFEKTKTGSATEERAAVEVGVHFLSSSNRARTVFAGLDLRQIIGPIYVTRLGIRLEWYPRWISGTGVAGSWYFGDTAVSRERELQFQGNTFAVSISHQVIGARVFIEGAWGNYKEGPGFIYSSRRAGAETLRLQSISLGVQFPFQVSFLDGIQNGPEGARVRPSLTPQPYGEPL